jgi:hypothetical protein
MHKHFPFFYVEEFESDLIPNSHFPYLWLNLKIITP